MSGLGQVRQPIRCGRSAHPDQHEVVAALPYRGGRRERDSAPVPTLSRHDGEPWHLHFHRPDAGEARGWAASMATGLAVVLGNPAVERLGLCRAPACDRVYVDTSRNGTRSTACQNRVKAAAYRARQGAG